MAVISMAASSSNSILPRAASNGGLSAGEIAGAFIGVISAFLLLAVATFLLYRPERSRRYISPSTELSYHHPAECSETSHIPGPALAPQTQSPVAGPSRAWPAQNEKPTVVDEKRILDLDDTSYLSRLPKQQGQYISEYKQMGQ
jgi:hypothetical protein